MSGSPPETLQMPAKRPQAESGVSTTGATAGEQGGETKSHQPKGSPSTAGPKRRKSVGTEVAPTLSDEPPRLPTSITDAPIRGADSFASIVGGDDGPGLAQAPRNLGKARIVDEPLAGRQIVSRRYRLIVVQQPIIGSAYGDDILSRVAIAPPLILELNAVDDEGEQIDIADEVPFLVCQCSLTLEDGANADLFSPSPTRSTTSSTQTSPTPSSSRGGKPSGSPLGTPSAGSREASATPGSAGRLNATSPVRGGTGKKRGRRRSGLAQSPAQATPSTPPSAPPLQEMVMPPARMLYGTLAANPVPYESPEGGQKFYLLFPEISVRAAGRFRLKCFLIRLPMPGATPSSPGALAEVITEPFDVVPNADYVAPHITDLTRHLARKGAGLLLPPGQAAD